MVMVSITMETMVKTQLVAAHLGTPETPESLLRVTGIREIVTTLLIMAALIM
jgi:hypothetical protein